jgi:hypothetical protein
MRNSPYAPARMLQFPVLCQRNSNACGTTCLAMVLTHLLHSSISREQVDAHIRRFDIFTAPGDIARLARSFGIQGVMYNYTSLNELKSWIDDGKPVIAMIRSSRSLHYVVVHNLRCDTAGAINSILFADPGTGQNAALSAREFTKIWGNLPGGFHQFSIVFSHEHSEIQSLPNRLTHVKFVLPLLDGITAASNAVHHGLMSRNAATLLRASIRLPFEVLKVLTITPLALFSLLFCALNRTLKITNS